jgi:demethylmenaquinone methyltransferase/2-methoxy-6-polyprenyl-1,4-benzoquinol methylase
MSTYVLMRILESAPRRYELGIRVITLGVVARAYDRLAGCIEAGQRVLDLGCGTGALAIRAAQRGASVKGIDVNPEMLAIAHERRQALALEERIVLSEAGVAELDRERAGSYDVVTSGLCLSELSEDEIAWTLAQVARILTPGGLFLVADETRPPGFVRRAVQSLIRVPLMVATVLITQQTTRLVVDLPGRLAAAGLDVVSVRASRLGSFVEVAARRPAGDAR